MLKGYIEGYYGRLLSNNQRKSVIDHMGKLNMDFYLYGPKEDPYHRVLWEKKYPLKEEKMLRELVCQCKKNKLKPVFSLSPGMKLIKFSSYQKRNLLSKIKQAKKIGFKDFAIFFDDLDHQRNESLAESHLEMIDLIRSIDSSQNTTLMVCPTVYCKSFAKGNLNSNVYLKTLCKGIDPSIAILWTGNEVVSESITKKDIKELQSLFPNPIIIWDNYYANDYCPSKFYIGPFNGRKSIYAEVDGLGINPTGLPLTDMICLSRVMTDKTDKQIFNEFKIPKEFRKISRYFSDPFKNLPSLSLKEIDKILETQVELCINWKSNLQLEWAPFLWQFYSDLRLLKKTKSKEGKFNLEEWLKRRYSDPIVKTVLRN